MPTPNGYLNPGDHVLSAMQFSRRGLEEIMGRAEALIAVASGEQTCEILKGALLANLFLEPSTRTRISFGAAFCRLGGKVLDTTGMASTSLAKGETMADTARVVSGYVDAVVLRHPMENASTEYAKSSLVPVVNAGDGGGEHPTQALTDLFTIKRELDRHGRTIDGAKIAIMGDLRYGRTVHSLILTLSRYKRLNFCLLSPESLALPDEYRRKAEANGHTITIARSITEALDGADVVYATRYQRERYEESDAAPNGIEGMLLNAEIFTRHAQPHAVIMHPLPRDSAVGELSTDLDSLDNLAIFRETDNGVPIRMALFSMIFGINDAELVSSKTKPSWSLRKRI